MAWVGWMPRDNSLEALLNIESFWTLREQHDAQERQHGCQEFQHVAAPFYKLLDETLSEIVKRIFYSLKL